MASPLIVAHVVTFNHERTIGRCLEALVAQEGIALGSELLVWVTDNASSDRSADEIRRFEPWISFWESRENTGFTGAHNHAIERAVGLGAEYVFLLNPDVRLEKDAILRLIDTLETDSRAGSACPKLLRADDNLEPVSPRRFDSTGIFFTPEIRHFDRGSNELDHGQYDRPEYVFGASGACVLYRVSFLRDAALTPDVPGGCSPVFDPLFFAYREDADLSWRGQWLGWKCRYEPRAVGYHLRKVLPENRSELAPELNAYSVRNRFLLQINNLSFSPKLWRAMWRNLLVCGGVVFKERSSLAALRSSAALAPVALRRRAWIRKRRRTRPFELVPWFDFSPVSAPALDAHGEASESERGLTVIIVNFNSGSRLRQCLESLEHGLSECWDQEPLQVCVVDNSSHDNSVEQIGEFRGGLARLHVLRSERNLGFAGAINHAAKICPAGKYLILNPDIRLEPEALRHLLDALAAHPDLGAVGPVLLDHSGRPQWEYIARRFPTLGSALVELFGIHRMMPNNPFTARYRMQRDRFFRRYVLRLTPGWLVPHDDLDRPLVVDQPAGACLLVRGSDFNRLGGFDEEYWPAWFEDVDFCRRLAQAGRLSAVVGQARVSHEGGYSYRQLGQAEFARIWYPNLARYWRKHGSARAAAILRAALPAALLLRALAAAARIPFKRWKREDDSRERELAGALWRLATEKSNESSRESK